MSLTSINPTAPHKGRQPQTQTLRQRKPSLVAARTLRNHLPEIAVVTLFACLLLASCAALPPYRSLAFSVISGTLASACESGQSRFTAFAISWNFASSMPGTVACIVSAIRSITKPSPCLARRTLACVSTLLLASPALSQANENAIVKHAACAAPRISSGLVPRRSPSKRLAHYTFKAGLRTKRK